MAVFRVYTEKMPAYAAEAKALLAEIRGALGIRSVAGVRVLSRYDVQGVEEAMFERCLPVVFFEPQVDTHCFSLPQGGYAAAFAVEPLPGQYDARAEGCAECVQLVSQGERPLVRTAKVYLLLGTPDAEALQRIKKHLINPVECREADLGERKELAQPYAPPPDVAVLGGFCALRGAQLQSMVAQYALAMDADDLACCRDYFAAEGRDPTLTELRVLDTYWSDHCRHTTFLTTLTDVQFGRPDVAEAYERYLALRRELGREGRPVNLMDIATIGARALRARGQLPALDESDEVNACSVHAQVEVDGKAEPWLLMFKNETHNHPTEIEPFGGAATCLGGAIRDPLSGRAYVYQAMRVTGAADPTAPLAATLPGKLPQRRLTVTAAAGYSAYGNQIGLATGLVDEIYHPGYAAKRLEIGAVIGAAPLGHVRREAPAPGDAVVLVGGRTGRDGCGGATGSSKSHTVASLETCGAEVQKGNPVTERKLQRLLRDPHAAALIKRCNDFGAGGVSVAIGELADGLLIDLDAVPKKYDGLDGTELAISESQERMAVVVAPEDAQAFIDLANGENLEATVVAQVTREPRLRMAWRGRLIVDIGRDFLATNGAEKRAGARVAAAAAPVRAPQAGTFADRVTALAGSLHACSRQGLSERFDSTIGAGTVLMPFGGARQKTPAQAMAALLPVTRGETDTCSAMAYGFHPELMEADPYRGAYLAVAQSLLRLAASGFDARGAWLTLQEYFPRTGGDPARWGLPLQALLGALDAQLAFGTAAIGGKDSMSGTFETLDVPPTLVSFAVALGKAGQAVSPEFKAAGRALRYLHADPFDPEAFRGMLSLLARLSQAGKLASAWAVGYGGVAEGLFKMALGNRIGARVSEGFGCDLFAPHLGGVILELTPGEADAELLAASAALGETTEAYELCAGGERCPLDVVEAAYEARLSGVFPFRGQDAPVPDGTPQPPLLTYAVANWPVPAVRTARPVALIPVFPGTNCETDTARSLERAGAQPRILLLNNLSPGHVAQSAREVARAIGEAQMLVLPGGFSGGDEPDGSAKLIAAFFRSPEVRQAVETLLGKRDGLALGICNGFQALVKLGLLPFGRILDTDATCPTLTYNVIGRHQSMLVRTRVASTLSPWLRRCAVGDVHTVAVSHGEGRFVCAPQLLASLSQSGQIATQYVDESGQPTMDARCNPNGSAWAVEGLASPDGRVLGKMAHTERYAKTLYQNVPGQTFQPIFESGVAHFR